MNYLLLVILLVILSIFGVVVCSLKAGFKGVLIGNNPSNTDDYLWTSGVSNNIAKELYPGSNRDYAADRICRSSGYIGMKYPNGSPASFTSKSLGGAGDDEQTSFKCTDQLTDNILGYNMTDCISTNRATRLGYDWRDGMADAVCRDAGYDGVATDNYTSSCGGAGDDEAFKFKCSEKSFIKLPKSQSISAGFQDDLIRAGTQINGVTGNWVTCINDQLAQYEGYNGKDSMASDICNKGGFAGFDPTKTTSGCVLGADPGYKYSCIGAVSDQDFIQQFYKAGKCGSSTCRQNQMCTTDNTCVDNCEDDTTRPGYITMPGNGDNCAFNTTLFQSTVLPSTSRLGACTNSQVNDKGNLKKNWDQTPSSFTDPTYVSWVQQAAINCKNTANCKSVSVWLNGDVQYYGECTALNTDGNTKTYNINVNSLTLLGLSIVTQDKMYYKAMYFKNLSVVKGRPINSMYNIKSVYEHSPGLKFYIQAAPYAAIKYSNKNIDQFDFVQGVSPPGTITNSASITLDDKLTAVSDGKVYKLDNSDFTTGTPQWSLAFYDGGQQSNSPNPTNFIKVFQSNYKVNGVYPVIALTDTYGVYTWLDPNGASTYSTRINNGRWVKVNVTTLGTTTAYNVKDIVQLYNGVFVALSSTNEIGFINQEIDNVNARELKVDSNYYVMPVYTSGNLNINCISKRFVETSISGIGQINLPMVCGDYTLNLSNNGVLTLVCTLDNSVVYTAGTQGPASNYILFLQNDARLTVIDKTSSKNVWYSGGVQDVISNSYRLTLYDTGIFIVSDYLTEKFAWSSIDS